MANEIEKIKVELPDPELVLLADRIVHVIEEGRQGYVVPRYDVKNFEQKLYEMIEKRPSSIQSALEIHNHMVSICGKDIVKQKLYDILTGTTIRKWGGVTHNKEIFKLSTLSYAPSYKEVA